MSKGFVFAVSNNGVCSVVSANNGKRLTGGALKACERSILRNVKVCVFGEWGLFRAMRRGDVVGTVLRWRRACFVPAVSSVEVPISKGCAVIVGSFLWNCIIKRYRGSAVSRRLWMTKAEKEFALKLIRVHHPKEFHRTIFIAEWRTGFIGCATWFSRHLVSCRSAKVGEGWRKLRISYPKGFKVTHRASRWARTSLNSGLLLSNEAFLRSVASGSCPVRLSLSSYRWPVRSAVLGSLFKCFLSHRVRAVVTGEGFKPVVVRFVKAALRSLGFTGFKLSRQSICNAGLFVSKGFTGCSWPEMKIVRVSSHALFVAFVSLSRCLDWLCSPTSGGRGCPSSLRPILCGLVLSLLPIIGKGILCSAVE